METIFIINPCAGQGDKVDKLVASIQKTAAEAQIYFTRAVDDARRYVQEYCKKHGAARFIACGGDGTFCEVLNGAIAEPNAEFGVIPIGTGNDFCRNFGKDADFSNVLLQMTGKSVACDAIRYATTVAGVKKQGYCANMVNIGFDCHVAEKTAELKDKPFLSGHFAYLISIFVNLARKKGADLKIEIDGKIVHNGELLLTSVANGSYCGGGVKSNPTASVRSGFLDMNVIKNVSRMKFIRLLPYYIKGTFLELSRIEKVILRHKCKKVRITPNEGKMRICTDGEIVDAEAIEFEIVHRAFQFVVPSCNALQERELQGAL